MKNNCDFGKKGEELAKELLIERGHSIIASNYRCRSGEIDLITKKEGTINFVEVKTRTTDRFGMPADAVNHNKRKKISTAARFFLASYKGEYKACEFQVVEIMVRHTENLDFREGGHVI